MVYWFFLIICSKSYLYMSDINLQVFSPSLYSCAFFNGVFRSQNFIYTFDAKIITPKALY